MAAPYVEVENMWKWYCPECGEIEGKEVTYEETCIHCGSDVEWREEDE